jgi:hypothetical protein
MNSIENLKSAQLSKAARAQWRSLFHFLLLTLTRSLSRRLSSSPVRPIHRWAADPIATNWAVSTGATPARRATLHKRSHRRRPRAPRHQGAPSRPLHRRQRPPIQPLTVVSLRPKAAAVGYLARWAPLFCFASRESPTPASCPRAQPCLSSSPVMAGISRRTTGGEGGKESHVSNLGRPILAQRNSAIFIFPNDLFKFNSIMNSNFWNL